MIFKEYKLVITRYVAYKKLFLSHLLLLAPAASTTTVSTASASVATAAASPREKQLFTILETYKCEQLSRLINLPAPVSESSTEATTITGWSCVRHV